MAADYFLEIEAHFAGRRGTPFVLNSKDWALMKQWQEEGVPLPVVIEAIDSVFQKNEEKGSRKVINSLSYCRHAVKELWADRRDLQVGALESTPEEGAGALLETLAEEVEATAAAVGAEFAARIRSLTSESSIPRIEERLIELEEELIDALLAASPDRESIQEEAHALSAGANEKSRLRTETANLRRLVRDRSGVPRLTLFR